MEAPAPAGRPHPILNMEHSLELLQFTHQLCLLLRGHAGKDGALDQHLGTRGQGCCGCREPGLGRVLGLGAPTLGSSLGKCFMRTANVAPLSARWLARGSGSTTQLVAGSGSWGHKKFSCLSAHPGELGLSQEAQGEAD